MYGIRALDAGAQNDGLLLFIVRVIGAVIAFDIVNDTQSIISVVGLLVSYSFTWLSPLYLYLSLRNQVIPGKEESMPWRYVCLTSCWTGIRESGIRRQGHCLYACALLFAFIALSWHLISGSPADHRCAQFNLLYSCLLGRVPAGT
jgi:hypothetical protein